MGSTSSPSTGVPALKPTSVVIPSELVPERAGTVAFVGSQSRSGDWLLPRLFRIVSFLGNVEVDLTHARIGAGVSRIEVRAIMGNVEIKVPHELRVKCDGSVLLGNFEAHMKSQPMLPHDAPVIEITGMSLMGNVEVTVVDPNAPSWLERLASKIG